jgi:hypothetical protein
MPSTSCSVVSLVPKKYADTNLVLGHEAMVLRVGDFADHVESVVLQPDWKVANITRCSVKLFCALEEDIEHLIY